MCLRKANAFAWQQFDDNFAATDIRMHMRNRSAGMVSGDRSESNLTYAHATHCRIR